MELPQILRELRLKQNLTQKQLAEKVGLSKNSIQQYEAGKRQPNFEALTKLEKYFGVSAEYLNGYDNRNRYEEIKLETIEEMSYLLEGFSKLQSYLIKLPQHIQLNAITFINFAIKLLQVHSVKDCNLEQYYDVLNGFIMEFDRFNDAISNPNTNMAKTDIINLLAVYTKAISSSLEELIAVYDLEYNNTSTQNELENNTINDNNGWSTSETFIIDTFRSFEDNEKRKFLNGMRDFWSYTQIHKNH